MIQRPAAARLAAVLAIAAPIGVVAGTAQSSAQEPLPPECVNYPGYPGCPEPTTTDTTTVAPPAVPIGAPAPPVAPAPARPATPTPAVATRISSTVLRSRYRLDSKGRVTFTCRATGGTARFCRISLTPTRGKAIGVKTTRLTKNKATVRIKLRPAGLRKVRRAGARGLRVRASITVQSGARKRLAARSKTVRIIRR